MPPGQEASQRQMQFLWNLVQGGHEMQLGQYMPPQLQTQESTTATFQAGLTSGQASTWIEDLIFRVGAVPSGSRVDQMGNTKIASEKQIALYYAIAQEIADMGDPQWGQQQMQGRYSWTVSKWIKKLQDIKAKLGQPAQPQWGQQPGQQPQQPQQPQWGQPAQQPQAAPPAQQPQWGQQPVQPHVPAPTQQEPAFDAHGNRMPPSAGGDLPF